MNKRLYSVGWIEERQMWGAVIYREVGGDIHVLSVGLESSEQAAKEWAEGSIKLMDAHDNDDAELPDSYDRHHRH